MVNSGARTHAAHRLDDDHYARKYDGEHEDIAIKTKAHRRRPYSKYMSNIRDSDMCAIIKQSRFGV